MGGDAAGAVVVVVDVEVNVVVDMLVVVDDVLVVVDDVGTVRALSDELHAAHTITSNTHAPLRPRPCRTPS